VDLLPKAVMTDWLAPSERIWEHDGTPWRVVLRWAEIEGFAECVGIEIAPAADTPILRATVIRALPFGRLVRDARNARYDETLGPVIEALGDMPEATEIPRGSDREARAWGAKPDRRRPQLDDEHYVRVAHLYSSAANRGTPPRKAVASVMRVSEPTASRWIAEARGRGLLPPTSPGRARASAPTVEEDQ
jgi:hypothetical protein